MCWEDIHIGRKITGSERHVVIAANVAQQISPANKTRVSLILAGHPSNHVWFGFDPTVLATFSGMPIFVGGPPLMLNIKDHGDLLRQPLWAFCANGIIVNFWEGLLAETGKDPHFG